MKRTVGGEIEIGMPKRIWTASLSEAEHPREREKERMVGERWKQEACVDRWSRSGGEGGKQEEEAVRDMKACRKDKRGRGDSRQMSEK